jgi:PIN domain nuclease of toxin-antitoxin system
LILVDTHIVIWLAFERRRLSKKAATAISAARDGGIGVALSDISLWEIANAVRRKRVELDIRLEAFLHEVEERFNVLPITGETCARATALPAGFPNDPADRIIVGTALARGLTLITADAAIRRSGAVPTIW